MIRFSAAGERDLLKLPAPIQRRIADALRAIEAAPRQGPNIRKLSGAEALYRLRVGDLRVVYLLIGPDLLVSVVAHRRDVYRKTRRR